MAIKTLHLTNAYHPTSGGIRTFYRALLAQANEERRHMRLVVPGDLTRVEDVGAYGRIYSIAASPAPAFDRRYRMVMPNQYLRSSTRLRDILQAEQPDLVEICDKYSLFYLAAMLRKQMISGVKRPVLVGLSCERMDDNVAAYLGSGAIRRRLTRAYIRHLYGPPFDAHIANSEYTAEELRRSLWDRSDDFIHVTPMGVDASAFGPVHRDRELRRYLLSQAGGDNDSVLLVYAGRLSPEKHPHLLIDALACLVNRRHRLGGALDFRLVLAGDGPALPGILADAARRTPNRVHAMGVVRDRGALARLYASCDVFVHPNPREPFGIGPLEAMASRVPVVAPSAGGVLSYATPENAWLAAPDGESFAHAINAATQSRDAARLAAAMRTARSFDWPLVASRYFKLCDSLHRQHAAEFARPITLSHRTVTTLGQSA